MKPQSFNLELWLHLGKPDCIWTRSGDKVKKLTYHSNAINHNPFHFVLSGHIQRNTQDWLHLWTAEGIGMWPVAECHLLKTSGLFHQDDLMLHLEDKPRKLK